MKYIASWSGGKAEFLRRIDMQELENILEEIKAHRNFASECGNFNVASAFELCVEIIRNHMNDGWVSVEERVPKEEGYKVLVCSKKGNIDTGIYSPYTKQWFIGNISALGKDIIAWRPLPEPYHPERSEHDR